MPRRVAFLRGINVGRAKRIAMADLRSLFSDLGYADVGTLLNSGNVVFSAGSTRADRHSARIERAIQDLDEALRMMPEDADALSSRAFAYQQKGQSARALEDLDAALRLAPANAGALGNRGYIHYMMGDDERAIADATAALNIDARRAATWYLRGLARRRHGDASGGEADLSAARQLQPDVAERMLKIGLK